MFAKLQIIYKSIDTDRVCVSLAAM